MAKGKRLFNLALKKVTGRGMSITAKKRRLRVSLRESSRRETREVILNVGWRFV